jgi:hypothetical protein
MKDQLPVPIDTCPRFHRLSDTIQTIMLAMLVLISARLALYGIGAGNSGWVAMLYWMTDVFSIPFQGLFPVLSVGRYSLDAPAAFAGVVILLGGNGLSLALDMLRLYGKSKREEEVIVFQDFHA